MAIRLPQGDSQAYVAAFGLAAVYVAVLPAGVRIWHARDIERSWHHLAVKQPDAELAGVFWLDSVSRAKHVAARAADRNPPDAIRAVEAVLISAYEFGFRMVEHDAMMGRLAGQVTAFNRRFDAAMGAGGMSFFNREYRRRRLSCKIGRFLTYGQAVARLRKYLIMRYARNHDAIFTIAGDDLLGFVFGGEVRGSSSADNDNPAARRGAGVRRPVGRRKAAL